MKNFLQPLRWSVFLLFTFLYINVNAQCPGSVTATISSQTVATCPSNATVTIGSNANGEPTATYQAIVAPSGVSMAAQSSNVFTSLPPGTYTFKVSCGASSATVNTTVTTTYTQLTGTTSISNVCTNYTSGGTITVSASGGTTPYSYSIVKTTNANYSDALSLYGSANVFNPTDTGTYQVRIKDNCGNYITKTVILQHTAAPGFFNPFYIDNTQPCGSGNTTLFFSIVDAGGAQVNLTNYKIDLYKKATNCTRGDFIKSVTYASGDNQEIAIPLNQNLYIKVTNLCGDTTAMCYDYPTNSNFQTYWVMTQSDCSNASAPNGYVNLAMNYTAYGSYVVNYSVKKLDGTVVRTPTQDSLVFHHLPYDTYIITGVDECGLTDNDTLVPPSVGDAPSFNYWSDFACSNQTGTFTYHAFVDGYVNGLSNATITITSGPSNVGVAAQYLADLRVVIWKNMLPGNYTASIVTPCGNTTVNFIIDVNDVTVLQQDFVVTTQQACNNGGVINANLTYNGVGIISYKLYNASGTLLSINTNGNFGSLAAGNYVVKANIYNGWGCGPDEYTIDKNVTILPDGTPPQVIKKIVMICEDGSGNPTTLGKAILNCAGFAPFRVEIKKVSEPDANYVIKFNAATSNFTIDNLTAYEDYRIRITDQCGNTAQTDITVGIMQQLTPINNGAPCAGLSYTLSAPDMIDATYSWSKGGTVVSTSREIVFPFYNASNDGTYVCTIVMAGGCVTRVVTNVLNSSACSLLPISINNFSASITNCTAKLNWKINEINSVENISIQKSDNGIQFTTFQFLSGTNITMQTITDRNLLNGKNYYRLLIKEKNGSTIISNIVSVNNTCNSNNDISIYPNPIVKNGILNVNINSSSIGNTKLSIINTTGQNVLTKNLFTNIGNSLKQIELSKLPSGSYILNATLPIGELKSIKFTIN